MGFILYRICICFVLAQRQLVEPLPLGDELRKYLESDKYQLLGPKEFVKVYNKDGDEASVSKVSDNTEDSDYILYGKLFLLKRLTDASTSVQGHDPETNLIAQDYPIKYHYPGLYSASSYKDAILFPKDEQKNAVNMKYRKHVLENTSKVLPEYGAMHGKEVTDSSQTLHIPTLEGVKIFKDLSEKTAEIDSTEESLESEFSDMYDLEKELKITTVKSNIEGNQQESSLGALSVQDLKNWAAKKLNITFPHETNSEAEKNHYNKDTPPYMELGFKSLIIVPSLKNSSGCPTGQRKNHNGRCVNLYIHRGNAAQSNFRPTSRNTASILVSIMDKLESMEHKTEHALEDFIGNSTDGKIHSDEIMTISKGVDSILNLKEMLVSVDAVSSSSTEKSTQVE